MSHLDLLLQLLVRSGLLLAHPWLGHPSALSGIVLRYKDRWHLWKENIDRNTDQEGGARHKAGVHLQAPAGAAWGQDRHRDQLPGQDGGARHQADTPYPQDVNKKTCFFLTPPLCAASIYMNYLDWCFLSKLIVTYDSDQKFLWLDFRFWKFWDFTVQRRIF